MFKIIEYGLCSQCECCGKHGPSDWVFESRLIPPSCCSQVGVTICNQSIAYQTGCIERIEESVHYVAYLCLIFAIVCVRFHQILF